MNLSNKSQALEDAAREILEGYGYGATRGSNWKAVRNGSASLDKMIDTAKTTKSKNNFYIFNNKGQIYHTAPTLEKARQHAAEFNRSTSKEIGYPTILDLSKGKIVESAGIKESSKAKTIKVGENAINAKSTQYVLVKDRKIVAIGEKEELLQKSKAEGGRVWIVGEHKGIGDLLESTTEDSDIKESFAVDPVAAVFMGSAVVTSILSPWILGWVAQKLLPASLTKWIKNFAETKFKALLKKMNFVNIYKLSKEATEAIKNSKEIQTLIKEGIVIRRDGVAVWKPNRKKQFIKLLKDIPEYNEMKAEKTADQIKKYINDIKKELGDELKKAVADKKESLDEEEGESTKLREKTDLKAWDDGGTHANSMMKIKEFIGPEELDSKFGTRKCLEIEKISEGRVSKHTTTTYLSLNANDIKVIKEFLDTYETDEDKPNV